MLPWTPSLNVLHSRITLSGRKQISQQIGSNTKQMAIDCNQSCGSKQPNAANAGKQQHLTRNHLKFSINGFFIVWPLYSWGLFLLLHCRCCLPMLCGYCVSEYVALPFAAAATDFLSFLAGGCGVLVICFSKSQHLCCWYNNNRVLMFFCFFCRPYIRVTG